MEDFICKRKKKSDKSKRNKELYGKYNPKHIRKYTNIINDINKNKLQKSL
jgi:hypothetical protein